MIEEMKMFVWTMFDYINAWSESYDEAKLAYKTYSELSSLSDTELNHLGLARSDIPRVSFRLDK
jgi:hypothetical protein